MYRRTLPSCLATLAILAIDLPAGAGAVPSHWMTIRGIVAGFVPLEGPGKDRGKDKVSIRGNVERILPVSPAQKERGILARVLVKGKKEADTAYAIAVVEITKESRVFKQAGGKRQKAKAGEVAKGSRVEIMFTGAVRESFPVQAVAKSLLILKPAK